MPLPRSVIGDGLVKVQWVEAIANPAAPKLTEVNALTSFDASCYFTPDGFTTGGDSARVTDDRFCSVQTFEKIGTESNTLALKYVFQPQGQDEDDNEAFLTFLRNAQGFFVARYGIAYTTAFATGDVVDVWPVELDTQRKAATARNETLKIEQGTSVIDEVRRDVLIVAGP
jgi:hypothetical protein